MSNHNPHSGHDPHDPDHGQVESSALSPKPVLLFMAVLFFATAFVFFVVKGLDFGFRKLELENEGQGQPQTEVQTGRRLPPEPLLQGAPGKGDKPTELPLEEMATLRKQKEQQLNSYGWVDKTSGIARIPIDRAKDIIAEKGLLALPSSAIAEEVQNAATARKEILNAGSSAGQRIKTPAPSQQPAPQPTLQAAPQPAQQPQQIQQQVPPQQH
ncbi:MAG TPA: hypothetical protein VI479_22785 [Blastocatellia bacterium]